MAFAIRIGDLTLVIPVTKEHHLAAHLRCDIAQGVDVAFFHGEDQVIVTAQAG
ncbi:hypothetical protein D3C76_1424350 [compost metagenome]